jgi:hypothetical protein
MVPSFNYERFEVEDEYELKTSKSQQNTLQSLLDAEEELSSIFNNSARKCKVRPLLSNSNLP